MATPIKSHIHGFMRSDNGLRDYQKEAKRDIYAAWDETNNVMFQMPTGTGKTVLFASIINDLTMQHDLKGVRPIKILIIAHRDELIDQISQHISRRAIKHGIIQGGKKKDYSLPVQVGSIFTVSHKRREEEIRTLNFDYIIIDEAHHATAELYRKLWDYFPDSKKLGVTATPCRLDGSSFTDLFDKLILSWPVKKFIKENWLSKYNYFSVPPTADEKAALASIKKFTAGDYDPTELERKFDNMHIRARLYQAYEQYAKGKKGIVYAIKIKHSNNICEDYKRHGVRAVSIDSKMPAKQRRQLVEDFKLGKIDVIVNVDIFSEGFDCPDIEFIQLARPTQSLTKYLQQVGRGLRITANKTHCVILDNVGMYERFGFPNTDRKWRHHFLGKNKEEKEVKEEKPIVTKEYTAPDLSEGKEEMAMLQGEVQYMNLNTTDAEPDPLSFEMPEMLYSLRLYLDEIGYIIENMALYDDDEDVIYDYHVTIDNTIQIYKLDYSYNSLEFVWNDAKDEYEYRYDEPCTERDSYLDSIYKEKLYEYWEDESNKFVVATIKPKEGEIYEKFLLCSITNEEYLDSIKKFVKKGIEFEKGDRSFLITKYTAYSAYLIAPRVDLSRTGNNAVIAKSSPLAHLFKGDLSKVGRNILYYSDDEIWFKVVDSEVDSCHIEKFTRDGRPLGEDTPRSIESETNFQKMFWDKGRQFWNDERLRKQLILLAPYLYKKHCKRDFSFDLNEGPGLLPLKKNAKVKKEVIIQEDAIEFESKCLYAIKTESGYEVRRYDGKNKWDVKLQKTIDAEGHTRKAHYYFLWIDGYLFALSSETFPKLWEADEPLCLTNEIGIVYRPNGRCDYFNRDSKLGIIRNAYYSRIDDHIRIYKNKKSFVLIGPNLEFVKTVVNKFHNGDGYYHDGKPLKLDI